MNFEQIIARESAVKLSSTAQRRMFLKGKYKRLRALHGRNFGSNYDISNRCNLFCEGCLYFAGGEYETYSDNTKNDTWDTFFAKEAKRGVNFAYIGGAEPSLEPARIAAAAKHIPAGIIMTNGVKRIDTSIPYRIHISIWGDMDNVAKYRGADTTTKAMRNYKNDPRAVMVMTVSNQNIAQIPNVVAQCAEFGLPLTFSYFSATVDYMKRLRGEEHSDAYIFTSTPEDNLRMTPSDFKAARAQIDAAIEAYPDTVIYERHYDDWIAQDEPLYELDANGIATNCGNRLNANFHHFDVEQNEHQGKCCSPNIDCSDCKAYAMGLGSYIVLHKDLRDLDKFEKWLAVFEHWMRLYMPVEIVRKMSEPNLEFMS